MRIRFLLFAMLITARLLAQQEGSFVNPVIRGDVPDPSVIRIGNTYYASGTSSEWAPYYPIFASVDLVNWRQTGHVFNTQPEWTSNSFWAPELFYYRDKVYCYYTARNKQTKISCIGVAVADSPSDEFVDHGPIVEFGKEAIDAFVFNDNGQLYISWKAYGLDFRPVEILCAKLSADGLSLQGEPFSLLVDDENIGMEGQCQFKHGEYYYLVYAAHGCCGPNSDYDVYVARSKNIEGPYEKYRGNPILHGGSGDYQSCGHGTMVNTPDGRMFYLCHSYLMGDGFFTGRQPMLQEMEFTDDNWLRFTTGDLAIISQPLPFKDSEQQLASSFLDQFKQERLDLGWTWNYPYAIVDTSIRKGKLYLTGTMKQGSANGTALCRRPSSANYSFVTQVVDKNTAFSGLTLYGDDQNLIAWGVKDGTLILKVIKDNRETVLLEQGIKIKSPYLKIVVEKGVMFSFYYGKNGKDWTAVREKEPLNGASLIRWDRVQRPGLLHSGPEDIPAVFGFFQMENL